jgi:hypothetical protein
MEQGPLIIVQLARRLSAVTTIRRAGHSPVGRTGIDDPSVRCDRDVPTQPLGAEPGQRRAGIEREVNRVLAGPNSHAPLRRTSLRWRRKCLRSGVVFPGTLAASSQRRSRTASAANGRPIKDAASSAENGPPCNSRLRTEPADNAAK